MDGTNEGLREKCENLRPKEKKRKKRRKLKEKRQ